MRFIDDGVNLPDELLRAHDEGRVVFMCGAGVSKAKAGLPDFATLTGKVLHGLGADESEDAFRLHRTIKSAATASEIKPFLSADHVFHLLERSFTRADIGTEVARALAPGPDVDLGAHRTLLALSRRKSGAVRLVTTNFDRLFEQCGRRLATVTRSSLPDPGAGPADWGIVHLHGCVDRAYAGPTADGFVLSSGSFGDAYLATGWAREFVKAVLGQYVVVFVGYSADDPPIRYLLQGLQQSNSASHATYAFQRCSDADAVAAWREKGVEPLLYETTPGCGHRALWETLGHWSVRARDPGRWRDRVLARARRGPRALAPHERGMVAHIVSDVEGAEAFARRQPPLPAEWLCVFDPRIRYPASFLNSRRGNRPRGLREVGPDHPGRIRYVGRPVHGTAVDRCHGQDEGVSGVQLCRHLFARGRDCLRIGPAPLDRNEPQPPGRGIPALDIVTAILRQYVTGFASRLRSCSMTASIAVASTPAWPVG